MDVNGLIVETLKSLVPDVKHNTYTGTNTTYIIFNYEDDRAESFADDEPQDETAYLQIHLFTPNKYLTLKKQIRSRLFKAGFSYPQITELYDEAAKANHVIFQCNITGNAETEE